MPIAQLASSRSGGVIGRSASLSTSSTTRATVVQLIGWAHPGPANEPIPPVSIAVGATPSIASIGSVWPLLDVTFGSGGAQSQFSCDLTNGLVLTLPCNELIVNARTPPGAVGMFWNVSAFMGLGMAGKATATLTNIATVNAGLTVEAVLGAGSIPGWDTTLSDIPPFARALRILSSRNDYPNYLVEISTGVSTIAAYRPSGPDDRIPIPPNSFVVNLTNSSANNAVLRVVYELAF